MVSLPEKYRPKTFDEIIGQDDIKESLKTLVRAVKEGKATLKHMLFIGPPGTGKTTMAHVIARELGIPIIEYNASDERGIQVVREKIKKLAMSMGKRIILLDEADAMTEDAQQALRRIMERAEANTQTVFILTANFEWKIIDPIKSRCLIYRFSPLPKDQILKRLVFIVKNELKERGIKLSKEKLGELKEALRIIIDISRGDMRKALRYLEQVLASGEEITVDVVRKLVAPDTILKALDKALNGDLERAKELLKEAILENRTSPETMIEMLYNAIENIPDQVIKAKLFMDLRNVDMAIGMGRSPLIHLTGFLATAWILSLSRKEMNNLLATKKPVQQTLLG